MSQVQPSNAPLITVAMPIFNAGSCLRLAVLSIVRQTFTDWELLIIDDGSTDNALQDIDDIRDKRIRILKDGANKGLAARLNEAIDLARGRYLARMDQDDVSYPERFARQVEALEKDPRLDLVAAHAVTIDGDHRLTGRLPAASQGEIIAKPWRGFYLPHPTWMGRIEWFRKFRYAEPGPYFCEDQELLLRSYEESSFGVIEEPLLAYRIRGKTARRKLIKTRLTVLQVQWRHFLSKGQLFFALMAVLTFGGRLALDVLRPVLGTMYPIIRIPGEEISQTWRSVLNHIQEGAGDAKVISSDRQLREPAPGIHPLAGRRIAMIATVSYHLVNQLGCQAEYFRDIGMSVVLVSSAGPEIAKIPTGPRLRYEVIEIPRSLTPVPDLLALVRLTKFFLTRRFDLVHSTTPKAGLLTALAAFIACVPVRLHTFTGQPWVTLRGPLRWASRSADRLIGLLNTRCYADSGSQAAFLAAEGILPAEKISVIGHGSLAGVDMKRFDPGLWTEDRKREIRRSLGIAPSATVIVFVGRISPDKGIAELIDAFRGLMEAGRDVDLLLVGPHDRERGGVSEFDLDDALQCPRIHYLGYAPDPERCLAVSDIFCLPSYREGFGTVAIEAAAMGLPTVGTAIYGLTDAVADGDTGILVPPRDARALEGALRRLLDHPDERARMGAAARRRCFERFETSRVNAQVAAEYLRILKKKCLI